MLISEKIFLVLAALSMIAIFVVIVRKFSVLSILNTENIPGEKEASFKKEIIKKRVNRDLSRIFKFLPLFATSVKKRVKSSLLYLENSLNKVKLSYLKKKFVSVGEKNQMIKDLFREADVLEKREEFALAENKFLEIINLDQNNLKAFFYLGKVYYDLNKLTESIQTLGYALKLAIKEKKELGELEGDISIAEIYFSLAEVAKDMERYDYALEAISDALDLEANNPRYLDLVIDLSIIKKDKNLASSYIARMSEINPDNNNLKSWREEIMSLPDDSKS